MLLRSEGSPDVVLFCDGGSLSAMDGGSGRTLAEVAAADGGCQGVEGWSTGKLFVPKLELTLLIGDTGGQVREMQRASQVRVVASCRGQEL